MSKEKQHITTHEAQIYDRQIRLWGMEAQNRLRNSTVLLVGLSGLGAEVAKNLMLSGLKSLVLMDDKEFSEMDESSQFLIESLNDKRRNRAEASLERVIVLNPMVNVTAITESIMSKSEDFFKQFDLVILIDQVFSTTNHVNKICRKHKIRFQAGGIYGWIGYGFFDFNNQIFLIPKPKEIEATVESFLGVDENGESSQADTRKKAKMNGGDKVVKTLTLEEEEADCGIKQSVLFPSYEQTFDIKLGIKKLLRRRFTLPGSYYVIRAFLQMEKEKNGNYTIDEVFNQWKHELQEACLDESKQKFRREDFYLFFKPPLNPVCAIIGSILSQEAIKALSQKDIPLKNVFLYSALDSAGYVCEITA